jgi:hypothetical protein
MSISINTLTRLYRKTVLQGSDFVISFTSLFKWGAVGYEIVASCIDVNVCGMNKAF